MKKTAARHEGWIQRRFATIDLNDPRQRRWIIFFVVGGVIEIMLLAAVGFRGAEFMDSPKFCGELCHTVMKPQYTVYDESPHARVNCVNCHIGPGADWLVKSKINGIPQVFATIFNTYQRPIPSPVENLRPARETCERCHWPEKFTEDRLRVARHYAEDERNTEQPRTTAFKVGGGKADGARGIHWHIAARVWYLPLDEKRQEIAWVGVQNGDGTLREYVLPTKASEVTPERLEKDKRLMDCIDCHNRATHVFRSPSQRVDNLISRGKIDRNLPFVKKKAMEAFTGSELDLEATLGKIEGLKAFYQESYPAIFTEKKERIEGVIAELARVARESIFPEMKTNWKTHVDNIGHLESPGCFRCHGKLSTPGENKKTIDATCQECHYSMQVAPAGGNR
ncbi:MAG: NapC/NirT family cytochrome c [Chloroflexi bacterium]|nr:NapC/NirT family cytochrome c [Chloroflexota bacterium]